MLAILLSPLARWAALGAVLAAISGWGWVERAGRINADLRAQAAEREAAGLHERIRQMEVRRREDDRATRDPDPMRSLHDGGWVRP